MLEDVVGYLLGALDHEELDRVARYLSADEENHRQAERLRGVLARWECCRVEHQAPDGLALRTCTLIFAASEEPGHAS